MKRNLLAVFTGALLMLAVSSSAHSQFSFIKLETQKGLVLDEISDFKAPDVDPKNVAPKALKSLSKNFKNVTEERWFETANSFVAKFKINDVDYRADYDKKGHWLFTIRTYDETRLPENLRDMVKSTYYDYAITLVQEIEMPANVLTYIVHLDGKSQIIKLRISDGEMDEWQKFEKSK